MGGDSPDYLSLSFDDVQFLNENIFIINFHENKARVLVFNREGQFITQIGRIGSGPGEYQQPYKLHINKKENRITVADRHLRKLINYDLESFQYLSDEFIPFNFANCIWLSDEYIFWCNSGGIDTGKRKWHYACVTNENMEIVYTLHETSPSGHNIDFISLYEFQGNAFSGLPFSPLIYQISTEKATPATKITFGKQKLPPNSLVVDEKEDNMTWLNKIIQSDYINSFHAHETKDCLGVSFYGKTFQRHLGFYDKRTRTTHAFTTEEFIKRFSLPGVNDIINTHNGYFVARIEPRLLKRHSPQREELRQLAEQMTEEDNPVLCLFKFK